MCEYSLPIGRSCIYISSIIISCTLLAILNRMWCYLIYLLSTSFADPKSFDTVWFRGGLFNSEKGKLSKGIEQGADSVWYGKGLINSKSRKSSKCLKLLGTNQAVLFKSNGPNQNVLFWYNFDAAYQNSHFKFMGMSG